MLPDLSDSSARCSRRNLLSSGILRAKVCYIDKMLMAMWMRSSQQQMLIKKAVPIEGRQAGHRISAGK
jgi:hypothetical protein